MSEVQAADLITRATELLRTHLANTKASAAEQRYRFEHCLRVARIGRRVAAAEGLPVDVLELGCLLHDIGKYDAVAHVDHGRAGAIIVRDFFAECGYHGPHADEIILGIAMHVDDRANPRTAEYGYLSTEDQGTLADAHANPYLIFDSEPTTLARSIGDCDNIDRFSAYRIADTLKYRAFMDLSTREQREFIDSYLQILDTGFTLPTATATANELWIDCLEFQRTFFTRLAADLAES
ncbi:HD domain-containing protein [Trueperella sp. LYQ141]|uniref:HD domain-containing protein n=1 Tax=Trueperella sp. LYQ141 TaxID=3391058 RepID=UPI0039838A56